MTSPVDPIRRTGRVRASEARPAQDAPDFDERSLPVPIEPQAEAAPPLSGARPAAAGFAAHLLGQDGQKRGLRGGPATLDAAKSSYVRTEWSGAADRRAKAGRATKTEI
ncbi:hypothetical protein [Phenylobacterium sp.]|jgi:hypothetical protein|uniref:hypothetical protein n=1 Tax=Phenylobacterium sp. TaxID=1871053 RepID=UPI002F3F328F